MHKLLDYIHIRLRTSGNAQLWQEDADTESAHLRLPFPSPELREQQCIQLRQLAAFEALSDALGVNYTLHAGSAIGMMLWGAMLPWDDDLDVSMSRTDFHRLTENLTAWLRRDAPQSVRRESNMVWGSFPARLRRGGGHKSGAIGAHCGGGSGLFQIGWPANNTDVYARVLKLREVPRRSPGTACRDTVVLDPMGWPFGTLDIVTTMDGEPDTESMPPYNMAAPVESCSHPVCRSNTVPFQKVHFGGVRTRILSQSAMALYLDVNYGVSWRVRRSPQRWWEPTQFHVGSGEEHSAFQLYGSQRLSSSVSPCYKHVITWTQQEEWRRRPRQHGRDRERTPHGEHPLDRERTPWRTW